MANLPAKSNRAGIFHPLASIWGQPPFKYPGLESIAPSEASQEKDINPLRKDRREIWMGNSHTSKAKTGRNVKFRPLDDDDSADSETEAGHVYKEGARHVNLHPWLAGTGSISSTHSLTPTVLEDDVYSRHVVEKDSCQANSRTRPSTGFEGSDLPDYSDQEMDITSDSKAARHGPDWAPRFLRNKARFAKPHTKDPHVISPLDWITSDAGRRTTSQDPGDLLKRHESLRWQAFWRDVNERVQHQELP